MFVLGIVLLIVGAVVAYLATDRLMRAIGAAAAAIGLILVIVAVLPSDAHAAAAIALVPFWRRRQRPMRQIDPQFARVLASQVAIGTARNPEPTDPAKPLGKDYWTREMEQTSIRARSSLAMIGIMLLQACKDDPVVQETLRTDIEVDQSGPGVTLLRRVG